jgi:hypothetical protein
MFFLLTLPFRLFFGLLLGVLFLPFALLILPFLPSCASGDCPARKLAFRCWSSPPRCWCLHAVLSVPMIPLLPLAFIALCVWAIVGRPALRQPALTWPPSPSLQSGPHPQPRQGVTIVNPRR